MNGLMVLLAKNNAFSKNNGESLFFSGLEYSLLLYQVNQTMTIYFLPNWLKNGRQNQRING